MVNARSFVTSRDKEYNASKVGVADGSLTELL
jgi:hypothetical protein